MKYAFIVTIILIIITFLFYFKAIRCLILAHFFFKFSELYLNGKTFFISNLMNENDLKLIFT